MKKYGVLLSICIILLPYPFSLQISYNDETGVGNIYYVDQNHPLANDSNPGIEDLPWKTIGKASTTLQAGDTVFVKRGIYNEIVIPKNSGSNGDYISYIAYHGDEVIIDGKDISLPDDLAGLFHISNKSFIKISGFKIMNAGCHDNNAGILVYNSSHIIIENNYVHNTTSSGIGVWESSHIIIDGNEVELACNDGEQECITIATTSNFEVKNNHVHHGGAGTLGGEGIDAKDGSLNGKIYGNHVHDLNRLGIYVDAWNKHTYNIEVFQNVVYNCTSGFAVASERGGLLENVRIYNNVAYHNEWAGIEIGGWDYGYKHPMRNITIVNNNFCNNGGEWGVGVYHENPYAEDIIIRNNICSQNTGSQIEITSNVKDFTLDHNLIYGYSEHYGENYIEGDPLFINVSLGDFHLQAGSPAIDNGSVIDAPLVDFDGVFRPRKKGYDIGAFEFPRCMYYGVDTIEPNEFSFLKNYLGGNFAGIALECNVEQWQEALEKAEKNGIKLIIWPLGHGHQYTPWKWNGHGWNISEGMEVLQYAEEYISSGRKALLAVLMSHEPFWNDGNPFTTEQMKMLYTELKSVAPHVNLFVAFGCLSCFDGNPDTRIEDGLADIAGIWLHCFGGAEGSKEDALKRIDADYELIKRKGLNMKLFFAIQAFGIKGTGYRMPSATEMFEFGTKVFEKNKLDGIFWYPWDNPADYMEWLSKDRYDNDSKDRWEVVRQLANMYMEGNETIYVEITKPINGIYIMDRYVMSFSAPLIIGKITVEAEAIGKINKVEFHIDNELKHVDDQEPYSWLWNESAFGMHEIKVVAYSDEEASDEIDVIIFNF
ncbi:MAG TPA: DUF1565 domain-containing protein [Thermoplasmatales archaeon]|nr:DUF1565 domain-containing protein [Thermoplasmatales archaeon]